MKLAIIGCGLIGNKRALALEAEDSVECVFDPQTERAQALAAQSGARVAASFQAAVSDAAVDAVVIATTHDQLGRLALSAVEAGKHVLLEKPGARRPGELDPVLTAARAQQVCVHVGFNHRFHPAMQKAHALIRQGALGPLYYIRGRYGHGGRIGYDKEWRANPKVSGGGELLDQGAHLIDLAQWYFDAPFVDVQGTLATYFWDMPVEDNAFMLLRTKAGQVAHLHVTWTEWKNMFCLEITGRDAKLQIDGLGGSYGVERLAHYAMLPAMGPPDTTIWEYPGPDRSWRDEWKHFKREVANKTLACDPGLASTQAVLSTVETLYNSSGVSWLD